MDWPVFVYTSKYFEKLFDKNFEQIYVFTQMKTSELEKRIKNLRIGEVINVINTTERDRAYAAARTLKRLELIDFEITCFAKNDPTGWIVMRKPK